MRSSATSWPLATGVLVVLTFGIVLYVLETSIREAEGGAERAHRSIGAFSRLLSLLKDAETGQRGFLLTGDEAYLGPYRAALAEIGPARAALRDDAGPGHAGAAAELLRLADEKLAFMDEAIGTRRREGLAPALTLVETRLGKRLMDEIRALVAGVVRHEQARVDTFSTRARGRSAWLVSVIVVGTLLAAGGVFASNQALRRYARRSDEAAAALDAQRRFLRAVIDADPNLIFVKDRDGRYTLANQALARLYGTTIDALVGHTDAEFSPEQAEIERFRRQDAEVIDSGRQFFTTREPVTSASGERLWIQKYKVPLRGAGGVQVLGIGIDVTERVLAEQALHASEARFRALIENSADLITVLDAAGVITYQSPASMRVLGRPPDALVGTNQLEIVHPDDRASLEAELERARELPAHAFHLEVRVRHADGAWRTLVSDARARLDDPAVRGIVLNSRDATQERRTEEQFRHAQKMEAVGRLAGGVAHDFNNALTAIRGITDLVREDLPADSPLHEDLEEVIRASEVATGITRQLLAFSRRQVLQPRVVDLDEVIRNLTKMLRHMIGEDVALSSTLAAGAGRVLADPGHIEQVLMNLAVNARDAMPRGGTLSIETRDVELDDDVPGAQMQVPAGRYLMLAVGDTGVGMAPEVREHIFEPFFTTKEQGKGTGLGLSTVYGIVRQSGGTIRVHSEPGRGTTFKIYLPRAGAHALARTGTPTPFKAAEGTGTVVLVEDEGAVRAFVRRVLQRRGYEVIEAENGEQALARLDGHVGLLRLLITDVVMPGMSGTALAERLRARQPHLPVLFTTGYTTTEIADRGVLPPDVELLEKPFTTEALLRKVADLTAGVGAA